MSTPPRPRKTAAPATKAAAAKAPAPPAAPVSKQAAPTPKAAKAAPAAPAPGPDTPLSAFVQLSALLTGFSAKVIAPTIDPIDLKTAFLTLVQQRTGPTCDAMLARYLSLVAQVAPGLTVDKMSAAQKEQIGNGVLGLGGATTDPLVAATAQAVMKLWYLGSWFQPFDFGAFKTDVAFGFVVSNQAYVKGLAWQAMQAHAMGNSTWTFGYWAKQPPPLSAFTGNQSPTPPPPATLNPA